MEPITGKLSEYCVACLTQCVVPFYLLTYLRTSHPLQGSRGHVNPKGPKAVISTFVERGYEHDRNATRMLRKCAKHPNFRNCILVFRRKAV